jgi:hypothetical protein
MTHEAATTISSDKIANADAVFAVGIGNPGGDTVGILLEPDQAPAELRTMPEFRQTRTRLDRAAGQGPPIGKA